MSNELKTSRCISYQLSLVRIASFESLSLTK